MPQGAFSGAARTATAENRDRHNFLRTTHLSPRDQGFEHPLRLVVENLVLHRCGDCLEDVSRNIEPTDGAAWYATSDDLDRCEEQR